MVPISARKLIMREERGTFLGSKPSLVKVFTADDQITLGRGEGSLDDPTVQGGDLDGGNVAMRSLSAGFEDLEVELRAAQWQRVPRSPRRQLKGYKFKARKGFSVAIKQGKKRGVIKVSLQSVFNFTFASIQRQPIIVELRVGGQLFCMQFGGQLKKSTDSKLVIVDAERPSGCAMP